MTIYLTLFLMVCFSNPSVLISFLPVFASQFFVLFIAAMASFFFLRPIDILTLKLFLVQYYFPWVDISSLLIVDFIDYFS